MTRGEDQEFWDTRHESAERYVTQLKTDPESLARRDVRWRMRRRPHPTP